MSGLGAGSGRMEVRPSVAATAAARSASATAGGFFAGVDVTSQLGLSGVNFPLHTILSQIASVVRSHRLYGVASEDEWRAERD